VTRRVSRGDILEFRLPLLAVRLRLQGCIVRARRLDDELVHFRALIANRKDVRLADLEGGALRPDVGITLNHAHCELTPTQIESPSRAATGRTSDDRSQQRVLFTACTI